MRSGGRSVNMGSVRGWSPAESSVRRSITICAAKVARIMTNMVDPRSQSGRTTMRSTMTPNTATPAMAIAAATGSGSPYRVSPT